MATVEEKCKRVEAFMSESGVNCLTYTVVDDNEDQYNFSYLGCNCCNDGLGQEVTKASGYDPKTGEVVEFERICAECLYIAAYGEAEDD